MNLVVDSYTRAPRAANPKGRCFMAKHRVEFNAHRTVREEVPVKFKTRDGERVSFEAKKKVKEPVRVKFMAKN
jgi:hypothetical protein